MNSEVRSLFHELDAAFRLLQDVKDYPSEKIKPAGEVDAAMRALGDHYGETGELSKGAAVYRELLAKMMITKSEERASLPKAACISRCYAALAPILRQMGRADEAGALDSQRLELWRAWDLKLPGNAFVGRQLESALRP